MDDFSFWFWFLVVLRAFVADASLLGFSIFSPLNLMKRSFPLCDVGVLDWLFPGVSSEPATGQ